MQDTKISRIRLGYDIVLSVATVLLGLMLILSASSIYFGGIESREKAANEARTEAVADGLDERAVELAVAAAVSAVKIYTRETVIEKLSSLPVIIAFLAWCFAALGAVVIELKAPRKAKSKPVPIPHMLEAGLERRLPDTPSEGNEEEFAKAIEACNKLKKRSKILFYVTTAVVALLALFSVIYMLDYLYFFGNNLNQEVIGMAFLMLPFVILMLAVAVLFVILRDRTVGEIISQSKLAISYGVAGSRKKSKSNRIWLNLLRAVLFVAGVSLAIIGCLNGSMREVFIKATKICTECIGLG